jgi:hypothetical protein
LSRKGLFELVSTIPWVSLEPPLHAELVFKRLGSQYFLARVTTEDESREIVLTPAQMERELVTIASKG